MPPPPPPKVESEKDKEVKKALEVRKREMLYGMTFKQRPMDLDHKKHMEREARREYEKSRDRKAKETPQWSAHEHWPSATAILLMRDGRKEAKGCPDHPEDSGPMYSWVEDRSKLVVRASTRKGLEQSSLKLHATKTSVECEINGVATPWCGHLVGRAYCGDRNGGERLQQGAAVSVFIDHREVNRVAVLDFGIAMTDLVVRLFHVDFRAPLFCIFFGNQYVDRYVLNVDVSIVFRSIFKGKLLGFTEKV